MKKILIFTLLLIVILISYVDFPKTFFLQDEWAVFGTLLSQEKYQGLRQIFFSFDVHFIPLNNLITLGLFKLFKLNFAGYAINNLLIHALISFLVFNLIEKLTGKRSLGIVCGLLFAVNSISHQAVSWLGTSIGTLYSALFLFISLIYWFSFVHANNKHRYTFILAIFSLIISLLFKETSLFLFLFLPISWWYLSIHEDKRFIKQAMLMLIAVGIIYFGLRMVMILNSALESSTDGQMRLLSPLVYLYRLIAVPAKTLSQSLIPAGLILKAARLMVSLSYPLYSKEGIVDPYVAESVAADIVSYGLTGLICILLWLVYQYLKKIKEGRLSKLIVLAVLFIIMGSWPLILIPGKAGYFSIIEPRHFYLLSFSSSVFWGLIIYSCCHRINPRNTGVLVAIVSLPIIFGHAMGVRGDIKKQVVNSQVRKSILTQIPNDYPQLPDKVIFYTDSDQAFYGLPPEEKILPFQSGLGQTLLVWYRIQVGNNIPSCLFENKYLYELLSQNYHECNGSGFGYYRNKRALVEALIKYNLSVENVIAYKYDSFANRLTDITGPIRAELNNKH